MCLLFLYLSSETNGDGYKLILVNVRDEYFQRPTKPCGIWSENKNIVGAQDLLKGREGGTWLAMNVKSGKIGVLLNVFQPKDELNQESPGRGLIVSNFVTLDSDENFLANLEKTKNEYNGFTFVSIWLLPVPVAFYVNNMLSNEIVNLKPGIHAFGNSKNPEEPWAKVIYGKDRFTKIVNEHPHVAEKQILIEELFKMLSDRTCLERDDRLFEQAGRSLEEFAKCLNYLYVKAPLEEYGTRTWTIILMDGKNNVDFIEKTRKDPIICVGKEVESDWETRHLEFRL